VIDSQGAAFNLKEHIGCHGRSRSRASFRDCISLARRYHGSGVVAIKNAVVYDTLTAFRYEDDIQNLLIWNSTIGDGVSRAFRAASSSSVGLDVRNLLVLGAQTELTAEAPRRPGTIEACRRRSPHASVPT
jgi:hypothetical protein